VVAVTLSALGVLATLDGWVHIVHNATIAQGLTHAILVPPAALWLGWVRRERLRHLHRVSGAWVGAVIALLGAVLYNMAQAGASSPLRDCGALLVVIGCFVAVMGRELFTAMLPAFIVLLFMLPVPPRVQAMIVEPLQTISVQLTQHAAGWFGLIVDPAHAGAAHGLRTTLGIALAFFTFAFSRPWRWDFRLLILAMSPMAAIVCIMLRLLPSAWIASQFAPDAGERVYTLGGWLLHAISVLILAGIVRFLKWATIPLGPYVLASD
jgi:hypothetical protein